MSTEVAVRNLGKAYGAVRATADISFEIAAGEILGLLGPNGAGKTTTVECLVGLIQPDVGAIEICSVDARRRPAAAREAIGVALQSTGLQDKVTPNEALDLFGGFYRAPLATGVLLERFGLMEKANARYDTLSGGQKQRLALALAFVNDPRVLFLDEPAAGLDPQMRRELHEHIRQFRADGRAVLLTTHDMDEAERLCDRVVVIDAGRSVAEGAARRPDRQVEQAGPGRRAADTGGRDPQTHRGRSVRGLIRHAVLSLKLNARNRMAMIYGYLFPLIFLVAFWAIYRHDRVPLALHLGQLLTVTVLGGACFGLPTTLVSERERGVWRRYRLTPLPGWAFVISVLAVRYLLLLSAALLQIALALAIGMPAPTHPLALLVAFTFASMAFMGVGLVIAMLADNVPAVQALGQCIFLPMLMIGGVAVRLSSLPDWAQHASAFFPGRYAVESMQATVTGAGLGRSGFELAALLLIGLAGGLAGVMMFRWDPSQKFALRRGKAWLLVALGMWAAVGLMAEARDRAGQARNAGPEPGAEAVGVAKDYLTPPQTPIPDGAKPMPTPRPDAAPAAAPAATSEVMAPSAPAPAVEPGQRPEPSSWQAVGPADIARIAFERLPPDEGVVSPVAASAEIPDPTVATQLDGVRAALADWPPGKVADPVQRARNLLFVAAVPDELQMEGIERFLPAVVFERLRVDIPATDLPGILFWVAMHPDDGDDSAMFQLAPLGLPKVSGSSKVARGRVMLYAFKLLGRLNGDIAPK